ncbi:unannotated protein [freshwater metagenome]|uniref:Unannotated protein n=1 Tax=freshwater metagenome TaxID=449393 RepID=A0A6J7FKB2_9ZZZZ
MPAQNCLDASKKFPRRVRLCHIIVGAQFEAHNDVDFGVFSGQHDDRHLRRTADRSAHLDARQFGQHEIEQDKPEVAPSEELDRRAAVFGNGDVIALFAEQERQGFAERNFVFN